MALEKEDLGHGHGTPSESPGLAVGGAVHPENSGIFSGVGEGEDVESGPHFPRTSRALDSSLLST